MQIFSLILNKVFLKYTVVGSVGTIIDVVAFHFFYKIIELNLNFSTSIAFTLAVINNFILNKIWTFENKDRNIRKLFIKFLLVSLVGLLFSNIFMVIFVNIFFIWHILAKLLTSGIVLIWNFLANKYWTFNVKDFGDNYEGKFKYDISIIIPLFNESKRIEQTLDQIIKYVNKKKFKYEIILVDDKSNDVTLEVLKKYQSHSIKILKNEKNMGKGYTVKKGILNSQGKIVLFTDADNSTPIEEFDKFFPFIKDFDVLIGSRYLNKSNVVVKQSKKRIFFSRLGNFFINMFLINDIKDTQCGFKVFKGDVARNIFSRCKINRWGFDVEVLAISQLLNFQIKEIPINWKDDKRSTFRALKGYLKTLFDLIYIKLNVWTGRYL